MQPFSNNSMSGKISPALVINNNDPMQLCRVQCRITDLHVNRPDSDIAWAIPLWGSPQGNGPGWGGYQIPSIGSKVAIMFPNDDQQKNDEHVQYYIGDYHDKMSQVPEFIAAYPNAYGHADIAGNLWITDTTAGTVLFRHFTGSYYQFNQNGSIEMAAAAAFNIKSATAINMDAPMVNINSGAASGLTITPRTPPAIPSVANMTDY